MLCISMNCSRAYATPIFSCHSGASHRFKILRATCGDVPLVPARGAGAPLRVPAALVPVIAEFPLRQGAADAPHRGLLPLLRRVMLFQC